MNTLQLKGSWTIIKGKLKQKYAASPRTTCDNITGMEDELIGRIQQRTGRTREEIQEKLEDECCYCGN